MKRFSLFLAGLFLLAGSAPAGGRKTSLSPTPFSVQMHTLPGRDFERHKRSVDLIRAAGIRQGRDECFWHMVEREKGVYKIPEHVLRNLDYSIEAGLETLIILNYANDLYDDGMAPTSPGAIRAFGRYCFTMARELKGKVRYFEIWNEPNADGFWRPHADPVAYTKLLEEAYRSIKEGNPDTVVCGISSAGLDEKFIGTVMDEGGYDYMDVVSLHPYCHPRTPEEARIFENMSAIRDKFAKYGPLKDIWVTEVGWPTNRGGGVTEYEQAVRISRTYLNSLAFEFIPTVFIYWFGPDGPDEEWAEHRFGVLHQDWSPKPSYHAIQTLISRLGNARFQKYAVKDESNLRVLEMKKSVGYIYAIWSLKGYASCEAGGKSPVRVFMMNGDSLELAPFQSRFFFRVSDLPILVQSPEPLSWKPHAGVEYGLHFEGNSRKVPRGQSRGLKVTPPLELGVDQVSFHGIEKSGLGIKKTPSGYEADVSPDAESGKLRFHVLVSGGDSSAPSSLIAEELEITDPVEIYISPLPPGKESRNFLVSLKNLSLERIGGNIEITPPDGVVLDKISFPLPSLRLGEIHTERVGIASRHPADRHYRVKIKARLDSGVTVLHEQLISYYSSIRVEKPPVLNGDLSDWPGDALPIRMGSKEQYIAGYVEWEGEKDSSANVYTAWDDKWFYIGVEFQDDRLSSPCAGFTVYNNDGIEIYFDTDHEGDRTESRYSSDDHQYGFSLEQGRAVVYSWSQIGDYSKNSRISLNLNPKSSQTLSGREFAGYIMEGAIPMKELGILPRDGLQIGFNLAATDDDDPETVHPFFQEIQFSWTSSKNSYQNPRVFGDLFFIDPSRKGKLSIKGGRSYLDGEPFLPFGFWTYGWNEERFRELESRGINALGVEFAWNRLEPAPDRFDRLFLEDCRALLDLARKYDISCIVQPGMHYSPPWLEREHPDLHFRKPDGTPGEGSFLPFCPDKPAYREELKPALQKFVSALKDHPALVAWSPWNEPGLKGDVCYCRETLERFGAAPPKAFSPGENWLSWMRFRQDNFREFFQWITGCIRDLDPDTPLVFKGVWCPLDSTVAWSHGTRLDFWAKLGEVMGHDPYPHPNDFFINRWVADWLQSAGGGRPSWFLEYNRAFARERGLPPPEEIRAWTFQSLAHGMDGFLYFFLPMNPFDSHESDNQLGLSYSGALEPVPALEEIFRISGDLKKLTPFLEEYELEEPKIAILHSWPTQFQLAGSMYPTANETVPAQILYRLGYSVKYLTEQDIQSGGLEGCRLVFVTGTVAVSDVTIDALKEFYRAGGHIFGCARFGEMDEKGAPREQTPLSLFGARVLERNTYPREKIAIPPFVSVAKYNDHTTKTVRLERYRYGTAHPMKWESPLFDSFYGADIRYKGEPFEDGTMIGFEDMAVTEEVIERVVAEKGAEVLASFRPLHPAIIATPRTIYVARDLSWCDETMVRFLQAVLKRAGIERFARVEGENGDSLPQVDVGVMENGKGSHLVFITCSGSLYEWDGTPLKAKIYLDSPGPFKDLLYKEKYGSLKGRDVVIDKILHPGDTLILVEEIPE